MAGRPTHDFWAKYDFEQIKVNGKNACFCNYCEKTLKNTAKQRLLAHRNVCKMPTISKEDVLNISSEGSNGDSDSSADNMPLSKLARLENKTNIISPASAKINDTPFGTHFDCNDQNTLSDTTVIESKGENSTFVPTLDSFLNVKSTSVASTSTASLASTSSMQDKVSTFY